MKDIFSEIVECLQKRERMVLATIISSDGSSPLPSGAMMLVKSAGSETAGTVGGGLLEALVIEEAKKYFTEQKSPRIGKFDLNDDVSNEGMVCGGSVNVLLEECVPEELSTFERISRLRNEGSDSILLRTLEISGEVHKTVIASKHDALPERMRNLLGRESENVTGLVHRSFGQDDVRRAPIPGGEIIIQPVKGVPELIIFGGGHVSRHLAQIASVAGFSTTVIDDREEFANPDRFPGALRVISMEYEKAFGRIEVRPSSYIVIVTRGHRFDELVLEKAIRTPAKYIGMIGSKRKVVECFEDLARRGVPIADLKRVHAPIGLDIGAVSAEEIAVSIVAELVRGRRGFAGPSDSISDQLVDWFTKRTE